jgi:ARG and Rhodanese-Phosphatase-superfamily-associated Protein domain
MRCRAFVHLVASVLASLAFAASAFADAGIQVSGPIVHDNLAIYLVHGSGGGGTVPLTLQEALAKGAVKVHETGSVNELTVENTGKDEVYV